MVNLSYENKTHTTMNDTATVATLCKLLSPMLIIQSFVARDFRP